MAVIKRGKIISSDNEIFEGSIAYSGNKITEVTKEDIASKDEKVYDVDGLYVSSGFIDLHMHGGFGFEFFECESADEVREALRRNALDGVTSVMPTMGGKEIFSEEDFTRFGYFTETMKDNNGAECLGVHIEGPYFPAELAPRGIMVEPKIDKLKALIEKAPCIKRISLAPEIPGGQDAIKFLQDNGIATAIGHSKAKSEDVKDAVKRGCKQVLHLYSGMEGVYRDEQSVRHPGLIELSYLYDELAVEVIANGKHMDEDLLKLVYKIKGAEGIFIVTDSHKREFSLRGDKSQYVLTSLKSDGKYHFNTAMPIPEMLRIMVQEAGADIKDVIKMATYTPAFVMNEHNRKGDLKIGMDADIVAFDDDFNIKLVIARGKEIVNEL